MRKRLLYAAVLIVAVVHQDFWLWDERNLVFGFLPVELLFHSLYTLAVAVLMWLLAEYAWPEDLEEEEDGS